MDFSRNDFDIGLVFADSLAGIISVVSGVRLDIMPAETETETETETEECEADLGGIAGVMNLGGTNKSGTLFLSADKSCLRTLCSLMTGVSENEVTKDEIYDTLCEIVNMLAGNAKLRLCGTDYMFSLSQPFVIDGSDMTIVTKKKSRVISRVLSDGKIRFSLKIVY